MTKIPATSMKENFFPKNIIDQLAIKIGLKPKLFSSKEEAISATIHKFLTSDKTAGAILELPPKEDSGQSSAK